MPTAADMFSKTRRDKQERESQAGITRLANLVLLQQELSDCEAEANRYFQWFQAMGWKKPRTWLLPTETIADLKPQQVECVLQNLKWFKKQITSVDDELNWM